MKLFGIPVRVDPSFLMLAVFLGLDRMNNVTLLLSWAAVVFVSVLLHEFGHALVGRAFGLSPSIMLYGMGGLTSWTEGRALAPIRRIAISLAGPFAGFLLGGIVYAVRLSSPPPAGSFLETLVWDLLWVNIGWGVLNLLPILPLDGGNVMKSTIDLVTKGRGETISRVVSLLLAAAIAILALRSAQLWGGLLGLMFAYQNGSALYQNWQAKSDPRTAYTMARVMARSGRLDEALAWLERAVGAGFRDLYALQNDPEFAPLHASPEFQQILRQIG